VSLQDMRNLHDLEYNLLSPLAKIVDTEAGPQMVRDEGNDPDNYSWTIVRDPDIALLNYGIYCELFHHNVDQIHNVAGPTAPVPKPLGLKIHRRWVAYCIPDVNNRRNRKWKEIKDFEHLSQTQMWYSCQA
jgi:hypothetical protein